MCIQNKFSVRQKLKSNVLKKILLTKSLKHLCLNTKNEFSYWHRKANVMEVDKRMKTTGTTTCKAAANS